MTRRGRTSRGAATPAGRAAPENRGQTSVGTATAGAAALGAGERLRLGDQLLVEHVLRRTRLVAVLALEVAAGERRHELVAAHPDVAVNPPHREDDAELPERPVPRERVVVVRVDERAVEIEQG